MVIELQSKVELLSDENFDFSDEKKEDDSGITQNSISNKEYKNIEEKYINTIKTITEHSRFSLKIIISTIIDNPDYKFSTDYQRRQRWSIEKQSRLIESFLMNIPVPPIFLYETNYSEYEVIDGVQRLTAIGKFYKDEIKLTGLTEWKELNGFTYSQLPSRLKRILDNKTLYFNILLQEKSEKEQSLELKHIVFERLNNGGMQLNNQEVRNALYNGPLNQLCLKLAENKYFRKLWGIPIKKKDESEEIFRKRLVENSQYKKMQDVELVLNFFAYRHIEQTDNNLTKDTLNAFLKQGNQFESDILTSYEVIFNNTIELVYNVLGENALKYLVEIGNQPSTEKQCSNNKFPTKIIYNPLMYVFQQYSDDSVRQQLLTNSEKIKKDIEEFYKKNHMVFNLAHTNKKDIILRINLFKKFFDQYLTPSTN